MIVGTARSGSGMWQGLEADHGASRFRGLALLLMLCALWALVSPSALPATEARPGPGDGFTVELAAWSEAEVDNDLLQATLSLERSGPDSARLAATVAVIMDRALAEAKRYPQVKVKTAGYSTWPVYQRQDGKSERVGWRINQSLVLESTEVEAATELIGRLQALDLQMTALNFTVSEVRREAVRAELTAAAIAAWRQKAEAAVKRLGGKIWRPHEVRIADEQFRPVQPLLRADAVMMSQPAPPPATEAGSSTVRVTVSGTAWGR